MNLQFGGKEGAANGAFEEYKTSKFDEWDGGSIGCTRAEFIDKGPSATLRWARMGAILADSSATDSNSANCLSVFAEVGTSTERAR